MPCDDESTVPADVVKSPVHLLSEAARIRRLARMFKGDRRGKRLDQFAEELEAKAGQIIRPR
jgi:DNA repair ATPase RecN